MLDLAVLHLHQIELILNHLYLFTRAISFSWNRKMWEHGEMSSQFQYGYQELDDTFYASNFFFNWSFGDNFTTGNL